MEHFLQSQVEITYVLSLYPSLTLPKSSTVAETDKFLDFTGDTSELSRASSDMSDDFASPPSSPLVESDESSGLESKKMSHNTLMALIKFLQRKRFNIVEKATAEVTEEVVSDAVGDHIVSYETSRPKISIKVSSIILLECGRHIYFSFLVCVCIYICVCMCILLMLSISWGSY